MKGNQLPNLYEDFERLAELQHKALMMCNDYEIVRHKFKICLDYHVNSTEIRNSLYQPDIDLPSYRERLYNVIQPVYDSAKMGGFTEWISEKTAVEIEWIEVIMQILVDADACPVVGIVESLAEKYNIPTTLLCDTNHVLYSDYSDVIIVGAGADAVDYKLISICHKGDIVVSQDYGVAAMALGKGAYAIYQSGKWYTDENIDQMLMERHLNKKARRGSHKNHIKGPRKRTEEDDVRFAQSFEK